MTSFSVAVPGITGYGASEPPDSSGLYLVLLLLYLCILKLLSFHLLLLAAYASRAWKTKSTVDETYSGAPTWFSSPHKWTCWRRSWGVQLSSFFFCWLLYLFFGLYVYHCHWMCQEFVWGCWCNATSYNSYAWRTRSYRKSKFNVLVVSILLLICRSSLCVLSYWMGS